jgi:predicted rRNA methylase YqxC with S4 and FtsJ domains
MRADLYIVSKGLAESRSRAKAYIEGGRPFVNGKNIKKCSYEIT